MKVVLYRVGRNLNRAVRTCEAFWVHELGLVECNGKLTGNLYGARGRVTLVELGALPMSVLALDTWGMDPLSEVDWNGIDTIVLGGETDGLPRRGWIHSARIPMFGAVSGLTVEAALAIALYEWRLRCH